ncbi:MAG: cyclic pyranopterin phosphate synthase MoaA [Methylophilales bacterium BACL14 MAG-120920-bin58]|jgi:GTP 3',8-cyclase|nr:MAG: cyclic pyranopterin phosphate synthase MoaA [Methylophilales bacterium BACL14 MAG-120920-bin58]
MTSQLIDQFNRTINYIRISVTDRCDFRCIYCMAEKMEFLPKTELLSLEEIDRIASIFISLGVEKIRITGGEPLVRKNIDSLFSSLSKNKGLKELTLTTNASQLKKKALMLKSSGVKRINISLDSLDPLTFKKMTRTGVLEDVLKGIEHAVEVGFEKIKLNTVLMKGINDHELFELIDYAIKHGLDISFIEEMPLGSTDFERKVTAVSNNDVLEKIKDKYSVKSISLSTGGPAKYWQVEGSNTRVGLISPHSHNFCEDCNRVRISCKGELFLCLGQEEKIELMPLLRNHLHDDQPIKDAIINSMKIKPLSHEFNLNQSKPAIVRFMSHTGG